MRNFSDTVPVKMTAQEADNVIRGSWPLTPHRTHGCDYTAHTSECADDDTDALPGGPMAALMLVGLLVVAAAVVAALVIVVLGVKA